MLWMDVAARLGVFGAGIGSLWNKKLKLWVNGRKNLAKRVGQEIQSNDRVIWFHAASYGEFEEGRPLIETIRSRYPEYKILVTFFSPSGYEAHKNYRFADWVFYLPIDTKKDVKAFLDAAHPEIAIFIKYEFWPNLMAELKKKQVRTFVISARFIPDSRFFKSYGGVFRNALNAFEKMFVQDQPSVKLLNSIGFNNVIVAGDPRFDRVKTIADTEWKDSIVEKFKNNQRVFIAGSTVGAPDEDLIQELINRHLETRFIVVPHEMDRVPMEKMISNIKGGGKLYSECNADTDFSATQLLIIDAVGLLSKLYRYGDWGFIGGGFDKGIHSVIEATIYGLPCAFGPNYQKNRPGIEMIEIGVCGAVKNIDELDVWFTPLKVESKLAEVRQKALEYTNNNCGATEIILNQVFLGRSE
ncbi:MAG: glycosyltransferase N-terminal domain-containing protein [Dysgonamonadaceae bacterium]